MTTQQRRWILGGGLASGKSKVRGLFADAGIATIDADSVGHAVLEPDGPAFANVVSQWPEVVLDGRIDRQALADIVFADSAQLGQLEGMTHPHIFDTIKARVEEIEGPVVVEMPILSDGLGPEWRLVVVDSRDDVKLQRAVARGMEEGDARARLASQPSRARWLSGADVVVPNHGSLTDLEAGVSQLLDHL